MPGKCVRDNCTSRTLKGCGLCEVHDEQRRKRNSSKRREKRAKISAGHMGTDYPPLCDYCGEVAILMPDTELYGRCYGGRYFWVCKPCVAYVGTHPNSGYRPLGRLAKQDLRNLKMQAHALLDSFWRGAVRLRGWSKSKARHAAYAWLAEQMNIQIHACHIGYFDKAETQRVIEICTAQIERRAI